MRKIKVITISRKRIFQALTGGVALIALFVLAVVPLIGGATNLVATVTGTGTAKLVPIYSVATEEKKVAISFDACWGAEYTDDILEAMDKYELKTTFFLVNIWLEEYPELAKEISERGHELGLHTVSHPHLGGLSEGEIREELTDNANLIEDLTGQKPKLFRPPFGEYNNKVIKVADSQGFQTIQWSIDSLDWMEGKTAQHIADRVLDNIGPGDIVLFHNNGEHTVEALTPIIEQLKKDGYEIVPISELIYHEDFYIDSAGIQRKK
ncbi:polysaccharide deacetylase family sporulation protein PdaB [Desulfitispora alkaliphila]|uniref:polysaccharide deacetylase family protein n=1 Tax=Desulfitispora alkaliphila TaxID=622674 RepID=UPI003D1AA63F